MVVPSVQRQLCDKYIIFNSKLLTLIFCSNHSNWIYITKHLRTPVIDWPFNWHDPGTALHHECWCRYTWDSTHTFIKNFYCNFLTPCLKTDNVEWVWSCNVTSLAWGQLLGNIKCLGNRRSSQAVYNITIVKHVDEAKCNKNCKKSVNTFSVS